VSAGTGHVLRGESPHVPGIEVGPASSMHTVVMMEEPRRTSSIDAPDSVGAAARVLPDASNGLRRDPEAWHS